MFKQKYLKYKNKYLQLKNQYGGIFSPEQKLLLDSIQPVKPSEMEKGKTYIALNNNLNYFYRTQPFVGIHESGFVSFSISGKMGSSINPDYVKYYNETDVAGVISIDPERAFSNKEPEPPLLPGAPPPPEPIKVNGITFPGSVVVNGIRYIRVSPRISMSDYPGKYIYTSYFNNLPHLEPKMIGVIGYSNYRREERKLYTEKGIYTRNYIYAENDPCYVRESPNTPPLTWLEKYNSLFSDLAKEGDLYNQAGELIFKNDVSRMKLFLELTNIDTNKLEIIYIKPIKSIEMMKLLIEKGYRINNMWGNSLILKLSKYTNSAYNYDRSLIDNFNKITQYLLSINPKLILDTDENGYNSLHYAVYNKNVELCHILLSQQNPKIDINAQISPSLFGYGPGTTALHFAVNKDESDEESKYIIQMLVDAGIDTELKMFPEYDCDKISKSGETAYEFGSKQEGKLGEFLLAYIHRPPEIPGDISTAGPGYRASLENAMSNKSIKFLKPNPVEIPSKPIELPGDLLEMQIKMKEEVLKLIGPGSGGPRANVPILIENKQNIEKGITTIGDGKDNREKAIKILLVQDLDWINKLIQIEQQKLDDLLKKEGNK
jgi:hypothetical protein